MRKKAASLKRAHEGLLESGMRLTAASENAEKERGWLQLAKYLMTAEELGRFSSFASTLARAYEIPTVGAALFVRAALHAFPPFRKMNDEKMESWLDALADAACESGDPHLARLTRELWSDGSLITGATPEEAATRFSARVARAVARVENVVREGASTGKGASKSIPPPSEARLHRGILAMGILEDCMKHSVYGSAVPSSILDAVGAAIGVEAWSAPVLRLIAALIEHAGWGIAGVSKRLCQSLVRLPPSASLFATLSSLVETLGPASHLHGHIAIVTSALTHPLPVEYADDAARLLEGVFARSGHLIDRAVLTSISASLCDAALRHRTPAYARIVAGLLTTGHDAVPPPIYVARRLIPSLPGSSAERMRLQALCDAFARPRTYALNPTVLREETSKAEQEAETLRREKAVEVKREVLPSNGAVEDDEEMEEEVEKEKEEEEEVEEEAEEEDDVPPVVETPKEQKANGKERKRKGGEEQPTEGPPPPKLSKKAWKKRAAEERKAREEVAIPTKSSQENTPIVVEAPKNKEAQPQTTTPQPVRGSRPLLIEPSSAVDDLLADLNV